MKITTTTPPLVWVEERKKWRAYEPTELSIDGHLIAKTHADFHTDLASIPWPFSIFIKPNIPKYTWAAFWHDYLYSHHGTTAVIAELNNYKSPREFADAVFRKLNKSWLAWPMWAWVRLFNGGAWKRYDRSGA